MRPTGLATLATLGAIALSLAGCNAGAKDTSAHPEPKVAPPSAAPQSAAAEGALHLGAPIATSADKASLADIAKNPSAFVGKTFVTTGTVSAVCQHKGCWMEIKDDAGEAHIKMAGHAFFVPKTASGRKARVLATLVKNEEEGACGEEGAMAGEKHAQGMGCKAEAEAQLGRPLAKLELVAEGVELM
jgi:hypothetical protein